MPYIFVTGRINYYEGTFSHVALDDGDADMSKLTGVRKCVNDSEPSYYGQKLPVGDAYVVEMPARSILNILSKQGYRVVTMTRSTELALLSPNDDKPYGVGICLFAWTLFKEDEGEEVEPKIEKKSSLWKRLCTWLHSSRANVRK